MGFYAEKNFPWLLDKLETPEMGEQRALVLNGVSGVVLEIGLGTGANLPYYPDDVRLLTAVEPSAAMQPRAEQRAKQAGRTITLTQQAGERLPFEVERFDAVVITLVLCTVEDVGTVLTEALRVLRPGGRCHFLEHVASPDPKVRKWQDRLNGVNKVVGCGCNLNRDTESAIRAAGFCIGRFDRPTLPRIMGKLHPLIRGVATKPEAIGSQNPASNPSSAARRR